MRRLVLLAVALSSFVFALETKSLQADACNCPWQVRQLTSTNSDCALATQNARQNAASWAELVCGNPPCTVVWTDLGCSTDSSGTATDTSLINFKCC
jgi:hypothetical protein